MAAKAKTRNYYSPDNFTTMVSFGNTKSQQQKSALDILLGPEEVPDDFPNCEEELEAFFAEKPVSREVNPLKWWKDNSCRFLRLAKVSRSLLSIPATSAPAER